MSKTVTSRVISSRSCSSLVQVCELQFAALIPKRRVRSNQLSDAGAVDIVHFRQVQDDFLCSFCGEVAHNLAEQNVSLAHGDSAADVEDDDVSELAGTWSAF